MMKHKLKVERKSKNRLQRRSPNAMSHYYDEQLFRLLVRLYIDITTVTTHLKLHIRARWRHIERHDVILAENISASEKNLVHQDFSSDLHETSSVEFQHTRAESFPAVGISPLPKTTDVRRFRRFQWRIDSQLMIDRLKPTSSS